MTTSLNAISQVRDHLFLAGYGCLTASSLKQYGITHAVDATNLKSKEYAGITRLEVLLTFFDEKVFLKVPIDDNTIAKISPHFETVAKFVEDAKAQGGKTVIYCAAGVSRSATLAIMCLVISEKLPLEQAYSQVNQVRPIISPNVGFWRQMIDYEKEHNGSNSVELITGRMARPIPSVYLHRSLAPVK